VSALPSDTCEHRPVVRLNKHAAREENKLHYLVCGECGLLINFTPLEDFGILTDDWREMPDIAEPGKPGAGLHA
jgi:hypothetical protein